MNYEEFLFRLSKELKTALEPAQGPLKIEISDIEKFAGKSYKGLMIGKSGSDLSMSLNLKAQFDQLSSGRPYVAILNEAISMVSRQLAQMPQIDQAYCGPANNDR